MEKKYVCACGLTCCDCLFYKPDFYNAAKMMKKVIDEYRIDFFLQVMSKKQNSSQLAKHLSQNENDYNKIFEIFEKMPEFLEVLEGIISIQCNDTCRNKDGCSVVGVTHKCTVISCVKEKGIQGCWECNENNDCEKLVFQKMNYGKTIDDNLKYIKENGIETLSSRGNQYYEWQRKIINKEER